MLYTYFCKECNKEKEIDHSIIDNPEIKCDCGNIMKRRIFGGTGVIYNAYGFSKKNGGIEPMKQTTKYHGIVKNN